MADDQPTVAVEEQQPAVQEAGDAAPEQQQEAPAPAEQAAAPAAEQPAAAAPAGEEAPSSVPDPAAAAAAAAAVAAKLMAQHVNAEFAAELNNKRPRDEADEEGGPDKKRASAGALDATNGGALGADPAPGGPMEVLDIPANAVGKLIGKAGETIRNLQLTTDTRIQVDHASEGDTKRVTITGMSADNVARCKAEITAILSDEEAKEELDCPAGIVGRIIGRGGETIRALQSASQAHVTVDQNFPEGQPRKIIVQGRPDACRRAAVIIRELINGEPGSAQAIIQRVCQEQGIGKTHVLQVPKGIVGRIIGRQGDTIKQLQRVTGATIQIDQSMDPCRVTVAGQPSSADQAKRMIEDITSGGDPFGHGAPGGGGFGAPPFGAAPFGGPPGGFGAPPFAAPFGAPYGGGFPPYGGGFPPYGGAPAPYGGAPGGGYRAPDPYGAAAAPGYGGFPGAGGYGGAPAGPPAAAPQWQELHDDQGRPYYYNPASGVTQWEKPPGM